MLSLRQWGFIQHEPTIMQECSKVLQPGVSNHWTRIWDWTVVWTVVWTIEWTLWEILYMQGNSCLPLVTCHDMTPLNNFQNEKLVIVLWIPNKCYINPTLLCDSQSCVRWCRGWIPAAVFPSAECTKEEWRIWGAYHGSLSHNPVYYYKLCSFRGGLLPMMSQFSCAYSNKLSKDMRYRSTLGIVFYLAEAI